MLSAAPTFELWQDLAHKWLLYAQMACTYGQAQNATRALQHAVALNPTMIDAYRLLWY